MRKLAVVFLLITTSLTFTLAQNVNEAIVMKRVLGGYQFYQGANRLTMNQLVNAMKPNEQAYLQIKSAKSTYTLAAIVGATGGFLVGWPLGTALGGGEPVWVMAGVGVGLIGVSVPLTRSFNRKAEQAIDTFNNGLQSSSFWDNTELKLAMTGNGIGLVFRF
ncbi:MAG: hypothetical protein AB7E36_15330 [Salinivirgaceae bacterium]